MADFGIALAVSTAGAGTRMTETGMSLGTPHYMAPEQAMGEREITPKADIYALGCVLYEMLTAEPPFTGATAQAIVARVVTEEPRSLTLQRKTIPLNVEAAVLTALAKLPADRFATAAAFSEALGKADYTLAATRAAPAARGAPRSGWQRVLAASAPWAVAGAAVAVALWSSARSRGAGTEPLIMRYSIGLPDSIRYEDATNQTIANAPDGSAFAYTSRAGIMLRYADRLDPVPVTGGRKASQPFFSPDGRWLGFLDNGHVLKVPLAGGVPVVICDSCPGYSFDWGADDTVRFYMFVNGARQITGVSAGGGRASMIVKPDSGSGEQFRFPVLLPDRRTVLFTIRTRETDRLAAFDLRTRKLTRFDQTGSSPHWVTGGYVVLGNRDGTLIAVPFDLARAKPSGPPVTILRDAMVEDAGAIKAGVSLTGSIVYVQPGAISERHLAVVGRDGRVSDLVPEGKAYAGPRLSPDGRRLAVGIAESGGSDVWVYDLGQHVWARVTTNRVSERPVWTPDGRRLVHASNADLWWVVADGSGHPDSLLVATGNRFPSAVTPDGRAVVFTETSSGFNGIRSLVFDSAPAARTIMPAAFNETAPALSADGRWLAYQSDEPGHSEVYVRPYPETGPRVPVSAQGGAEPVFSHDGRELYYRNGDTMMVATITLRPTFAVTARRALFSGSYLAGGAFREYDISPDGRQFYMVRGGTAPSSLLAVHGFFDRLRYESEKRR
ncbi:MAG: protein kinase [Gemmatimonadales bacterium]